jgi:hypothetical protein
MRINANSIEEYISQVPDDRRDAFSKLRETIAAKIPNGFHEEMSYGMIGFVVPHSIYPAGYHTTPKLPLPFVNLASQKNFISLYHTGIYANPKLLDWFTDEYLKRTGKKPDMGKGCIHFNSPWKIPYDLIGELMGKITVNDWIDLYERNYKKK